jgi:hypothetical protein
VRLRGPLHDPNWEVTDLSLEDIMLAYLGLSNAQPTDDVLSEVSA